MVTVSFSIAAFAMLFSANGVALDSGSQASMSVTSTAKMRRATVMTPADTPSEQPEVKTKLDDPLLKDKLEEVQTIEDQKQGLDKQQHSLEEQAKAEDMKVFKMADHDGNGFLDSGELVNLLSHAGLPANVLTWTAFDHDKDHQLSPSEFLEAGPAVNAAFRQIQEAHNFRIDRDRKIFASFDKDQSGFLDSAEMAYIEHAVGLEPGKLNWLLFDHDKDGKLSEVEFVAAGPIVAAAIADHRKADAVSVSQTEQPDSKKAQPTAAHQGAAGPPADSSSGNGDDDGSGGKNKEGKSPGSPSGAEGSPSPSPPPGAPGQPSGKKAEPAEKKQSSQKKQSSKQDGQPGSAKAEANSPSDDGPKDGAKSGKKQSEPTSSAEDGALNADNDPEDPDAAHRRLLNDRGPSPPPSDDGDKKKNGDEDNGSQDAANGKGKGKGKHNAAQDDKPKKKQVDPADPNGPGKQVDPAASNKKSKDDQKGKEPPEDAGADAGSPAPGPTSSA